MAKKIKFADHQKLSAHIPVWMDEIERLVLFDEAKKLDPGEQIIEVGCLYAGSTSALGHGSQNECPIQVYDDFSWWPSKEDSATPERFPKPTKVLALSNLEKAGLTEVTITEVDTLTLEPWKRPIGLLFIDGGHSMQYISHDLATFGPMARTILCHDYGNGTWFTIKDAVTKFLAEYTDYYLEEVVGTVAIIRKIVAIPF